MFTTSGTEELFKSFQRNEPTIFNYCNHAAMFMFYHHGFKVCCGQRQTPKKKRAQTCVNGIRSNLREHPAQQNHQPIFAPFFWYVLIDFDWPRWPLNLRSMGFLADLSRSQVANANHVAYMYMCWKIYHCIFRAASKEHISIAPLIANGYSCGNIPWTVFGSNSARFGPVTSKQQKNWTQGCSNKLAQILLGFDVAASTAPGLNEGKCHHIHCQTNCHVEIHPPRTRLALQPKISATGTCLWNSHRFPVSNPFLCQQNPPKKSGKQHESVTSCRCVACGVSRNNVHMFWQRWKQSQIQFAKRKTRSCAYTR